MVAPLFSYQRYDFVTEITTVSEGCNPPREDIPISEKCSSANAIYYGEGNGTGQQPTCQRKEYYNPSDDTWCKYDRCTYYFGGIDPDNGPFGCLQLGCDDPDLVAYRENEAAKCSEYGSYFENCTEDAEGNAVDQSICNESCSAPYFVELWETYSELNGTQGDCQEGFIQESVNPCNTDFDSQGIYVVVPPTVNCVSEDLSSSQETSSSSGASSSSDGVSSSEEMSSSSDGSSSDSGTSSGGSGTSSGSGSSSDSGTSSGDGSGTSSGSGSSSGSEGDTIVFDDTRIVERLDQVIYEIQEQKIALVNQIADLQTNQDINHTQLISTLEEQLLQLEKLDNLSTLDDINQTLETNEQILNTIASTQDQSNTILNSINSNATIQTQLDSLNLEAQNTIAQLLDSNNALLNRLGSESGTNSSQLGSIDGKLRDGLSYDSLNSSRYSSDSARGEGYLDGIEGYVNGSGLTDTFDTTAQEGFEKPNFDSSSVNLADPISFFTNMQGLNFSSSCPEAILNPTISIPSMGIDVRGINGCSNSVFFIGERHVLRVFGDVLYWASILLYWVIILAPKRSNPVNGDS